MNDIDHIETIAMLSWVYGPRQQQQQQQRF